MKAYRIKWEDLNRSVVVDLGYRYQLPRVRCHGCGTTWGNSFEYPAFNFDFLNDKDYKFARVVSVPEFIEISKRIQSAAGYDVLLVPGSCIGELSGTSITTKLDDFAWGRINPQISKRARDILSDEGIQLITGVVDIRCRGRKIESHLSLQVEPVALLADKSLQMHNINHCPTCGHYHHVYPKPNVLEGYLVKRSLWPTGKHLVTSAESLDIIASEEFIQAVTKHKLTGIRFKEYGQYI